MEFYFNKRSLEQLNFKREILGGIMFFPEKFCLTRRKKSINHSCSSLKLENRVSPAKKPKILISGNKVQSLC